MTPKQNDPSREIPANNPGWNSGRPETDGGAGRVDVTGKMPEAHPEKDITEGQPGYQESGGSEIIPNKRLQQDATDTTTRTEDRHKNVVVFEEGQDSHGGDRVSPQTRGGTPLGSDPRE